MTEEELIQTLLGAAHTRDELQLLLSELRLFLEREIFAGKTPAAKKDEATFKILKRLPEGIWGEFTKDNLYEILEKVKQASETIPTARLTLAFPPGEDLTAKLGKWFKENCGKNALLDVTVDPDILGGCLITWNNQQADYSVAKRLSEEREFIRKRLQDILEHSAEESDGS